MAFLAGEALKPCRGRGAGAGHVAAGARRREQGAQGGVADAHDWRNIQGWRRRGCSRSKRRLHGPGQPLACAPASRPARCEGRAKEERARRKSLIAAAVGGPSHDKVLIDVGQCVCVFQQRPHWSAHETHDIKTKRERELQMQKLCLLRSVLYS